MFAVTARQPRISKTSTASLRSTPTISQISTTTLTVSAPSSGLSSGEIGAIVGSVTAVIVISIIIAGLISCFRARRQDRESGTHDLDVPPHPEMGYTPQVITENINADGDMPSGLLRYPDAEIRDSGRLENKD